MTKSTRRRRLPALLATAAIGAGALALAAGTAQATPDFAITRIDGATRSHTAAAIATSSFPSGSATALIVRDDTFPDALAGNYMAGLLNAPILLSGTNDVPDVTLQALDTLNATSVTMLGGPSALSENVRNELLGIGLTVNRVNGADRFDTAARIALGAGPAAVGLNEDGDKTAILSSGLTFPDALAAGPISFSEHFPQLLAGQGTNGLPTVTGQALEALGVEHVIITGGPIALPSTVETALNGLGITYERIAGPTRFHTAFALAAKAGTDFGFTNEHVNFATAANFPDALAGGPHGGKELAATILVPPTPTHENAADVCAALTAIAPTLKTAHAFGGPVAIPEAVLTALDVCASGPAAPAAGTGQVVTVTNGSDQYSFVQNSDNEEVTVTHDAQDTFTVDGTAVSQAIFEGAITPGDTITFTDDTSATDADVHALTNVTVLSGTVGDVNVGANTLYIINPVTGDRVGGPFVWDDVNDNFGGTLADFEGAVSEGDTVVVAGTQAAPTGFTLTNATVTGPVTAQSSDATDAQIVVSGALGDDPANADDTEFVASAVAAPGAEVYVVDGATVAYAAFDTALSVGDTLAYKREVVAAVSTETFTLTNVAPPAVTGQVSSFVQTAEDPYPGPGDTEGDRFAVVPAAGGYVSVDYSDTPTFRVDNVVVTEAQFEAALTAGDTVTFQPGSAAPAIAETISLTNVALSGQWGGMDIGTDLYGVLAADKATLLAIVDYVGPGVPPLTNQYWINGVQRNLADWEALAADVLFDAADRDDTIAIDEAGGFRNHRLTTTDTLTP